MSWDLTYLQSLDPKSAAFETERCRLINEELNKIPIAHRKTALLLQFELDSLRAKLSPEDFMQAIVHKLREQAENLEDVAQYLRNTKSA